MTHILIDADDLIMALEYHGYEAEYFLDLHTGEVLFVPTKLSSEKSKVMTWKNKSKPILIATVPSTQFGHRSAGK